MAQLSPTMEEGKLIEWKVAEGDAVAQGDVVAEIETDKANMDVEALGGGVLRKIVVQAGATVPVGALIGVIAAPDESIDALLAEAEAAGGAGPAEEPAGGPADGPAEVPAPAPAPASEPPPAPAPASVAPSHGLEDRVEEASQMRKAIARRLGQSIGPVPHFFLTTEVDMGRALELRADLNARFADGRIGVTDLLLKATAEALNRHAGVNASWEENAIRYHGAVHLGIAVALDEGLITPVLRDAGRKGLRQISAEARDLIARARARKLAPEEYQGGTFSVSNLGMFEIDQFTAIINPPEAGILAIGQTVEKPVVVAGEVVVRKRMRVTMSCDHRVIDGATGAAFLVTFKAMLENPLEMIL